MEKTGNRSIDYAKGLAMTKEQQKIYPLKILQSQNDSYNQWFEVKNNYQGAPEFKEEFEVELYFLDWMSLYVRHQEEGGNFDIGLTKVIKDFFAEHIIAPSFNSTIFELLSTSTHCEEELEKCRMNEKEREEVLRKRAIEKLSKLSTEKLLKLSNEENENF